MGVGWVGLGGLAARGLILVRTRPQRGGGGATPSTAGDFVFGIRQGELFLFDPMCLYSKYSEFCGEFKNG